MKVHDEPARGTREAALLSAGLPLVVPELRFVGATSGQVVLVLDDVRHGAPRPASLAVGALAGAAAHLGRLHAVVTLRALSTHGVAPTPAAAWIDRTRRRVRDPRLPSTLRSALAGLVLVGDALCHLDLHASNWILDGTTPIGLLDWASAGLADPEHDLAALLMSAGGDAGPLPEVLDAWGGASGRTPDPVRVALYLWLLHAERRLAKGTGSPHEEVAASLATSGAAHGAARSPRVFPKNEFTGAWTPEVGLWHPVDDAVEGPAADALLGDLGIPGRITASYRRHACNDVLRVDVGIPAASCVLKVYEKPIWGPLFELERHLHARLEGGPATVPAPLALPDGRCLFRVGGRVATLTPYLGDDRPGSSLRDLERLAAAHAALHAVDGLAAAFPEIQPGAEEVPLAVVRLHAEAVLAPEVVEGLVVAWEWAQAALGGLSALPEGLVHGSLHRDHAAVLPDGRVAILDLEKVRIGPLVHDAVRSAVYAGYRGNDERADPGRIVYYLRAYDRIRPLTAAERAALVPSVLLALLRDVKALGQDNASAEGQRRHAGVVTEFFHNRANLAGAFSANLPAR